MESQSFPVCCGANLFTGFGNTDHAVNHTKYTPEEISRFLDSRYCPHLAFSMIVINEDQQKIMHTILKAKHWRCLARNLYHPMHNSHLFIYIREWNKNHYRNSKTNKK